MLQREKGFYLRWLQRQSRWHRERCLAFATIARMILRRLFSFALLLMSIVLAPVLLNVRATGLTAFLQDSNPGTSIAAPLGVAPDLDARVAKFKPIEMPFNRTGLSEREQKLVQKLVDAANHIEQIYWRQSDPEGLKLYSRLEKSTDPLDKKVLRFMKINGSRYDLIDELRPFVGKEPAPPGRALYPRGLTQTEIEKYVAAHPGQRPEIYNEHSILLRDENKMAAVPYHLAFVELLKPAA